MKTDKQILGPTILNRYFIRVHLWPNGVFARYRR
jgi:hypothetical protein